MSGRGEPLLRDTPATEAVPGLSPERMPLVVTGHVDHGKSTLVGRLLADTGSLPDGKLEAVRRTCARQGKRFEHAFLLDALKDEQAQGITIDTARVFFRTARRHYVILDAPGHVEFLKNMVTGACRADAALLVIDAHEGIMENSRRHGFMLSVLGIRQIAIVVNKMDLVGYSERVFDHLVTEYAAFLGRLGVKASRFIPASAGTGDNVVSVSKRLPWYDGPTVLEAIESFHSRPPLTATSFRMPVQGVYKFGKRPINDGSSPAPCRAVAFEPATKSCSIRRERRAAYARWRRSIALHRWKGRPTRQSGLRSPTSSISDAVRSRHWPDSRRRRSARDSRSASSGWGRLLLRLARSMS